MVRYTAIILLILSLFAVSCGKGKRLPAEDRSPLPYEQMRDGDLVFRCGLGMFSQAVTLAEKNRSYSHVGLLFKDGDVWTVVHAVPREPDYKGDFSRVKQEPLEKFLLPDMAIRAGLVHTGFSDSLKIEQMKAQAFQAVRDSVRFDDAYDLEDSTEVYCTEFVWRLYRRAGIDLTEGRRKFLRTVVINGDTLFPEHVYDYSLNTLYYSY